MAKRYIDSEIFKDPWFMDLPNKYKLFWIYLITNCDFAGVWEVNFKLASMFVGEHLEPSEVERYLRERIHKFNDGKYWFIPKYLKFQYPKGLNSNKPVVVSIKAKLLDYNLLTIITESLGNDYLIIKEKEKVIVKEIEIEKEKESTYRSGHLGPTLGKVLDLALTEKIDCEVAENFFYHYEAQEWETSGQNPRPITNWQMKLRQWVLNQSKYPTAQKSEAHPKIIEITKVN